MAGGHAHWETGDRRENEGDRSMYAQRGSQGKRYDEQGLDSVGVIISSQTHLDKLHHFSTLLLKDDP